LTVVNRAKVGRLVERVIVTTGLAISSVAVVLLIILLLG
jgi:hypothetical protein